MLAAEKTPVNERPFLTCAVCHHWRPHSFIRKDPVYGDVVHGKEVLKDQLIAHDLVFACSACQSTRVFGRE